MARPEPRLERRWFRAHASRLRQRYQLATRPVRPPGLRGAPHPVGLGQRALAVGPLHGLANAVVVHGQHVGSAQAEHEEHLGGPAADALDPDEGGHHVVVREPAQAAERQPVRGLLGQVAQVADLLAGEARGPELLVGKRRDVRRPRVLSAHGVAEAAVDRGRGLARDLLVQDGLDQRSKGAARRRPGEAGTSPPAR